MIIQVLTMKGCGPCERLKHKLRGDGIDFQEIDAAHHSDLTTELKKKLVEVGVRTVPAVFIDGEYKGDSETGYIAVLETL